MNFKSNIPKKCLIVLGMHRSGTSMVTGALNGLGLDIGKTILPPSTHNKSGFFENEKIIAFNENILAQRDKSWDYENGIVSKFNYYLDYEKLKSELQNILAIDFTDKETILIKDPRISILLDVWIKLLTELEIEFSFVHIVRNPVEVAQSLKARNSFSLEKSLVLWMNYNLYAEKYSRPYNSVVLHYHAFLEGPTKELQRIATGLNLKFLTDKIENKKDFLNSFINPKLNHAVHKEAVEMPALVQKTYELFKNDSAKDFHKKIDLIYHDFSSQMKLLYTDEIITKIAPSLKKESWYAQLYIDEGNGFSEEVSQRRSIKQGATSLEFEISNYQNIKRLRFDPANCPVYIKIKALAIFVDGKKRKLEFTRENSLAKIDETLLFDTSDPHMMFENLKDLKGKDILFKIEVTYTALEKNVIPFLRLHVHNLQETYRANVTTQAGKFRRLEENFHKISKTNNAAHTRLGELSKEYKDAIALNESINAERNNLIDKNAQIYKEIDALNSGLSSLTQNLNVAESEKQKLQESFEANKQAFEKERTQFKTEIEQTKAEIEQTKAAFEIKKSELSQLETKSLEEKNKFEKSALSLNNYINQLKIDNQLFENKLNAKQEALDDIESKWWFSIMGRTSKIFSNASQNLSILRSLLLIAIKNPIKTFKKLSPKKLSILKKALSTESKTTIIGNYEKLVVADRLNNIAENNGPDNNFYQSDLGSFRYHVEVCEIKNKNLTITGWALHQRPIKDVKIYLGRHLIHTLTLTLDRTDVEMLYSEFPNNLTCGFELIDFELPSADEDLKLKLSLVSGEAINLDFDLTILTSNTVPKPVSKTNFLTEYNYYQQPHPEHFVGYSKKNNQKEMTDVLKYIAYYLPQFHQIPENDKWWGEGFTEWTNVTKAVPRFKGHFQPKLPLDDIGYYDLSEIDSIRKQVEIATNYGLYGFCFHYYWFSGKRLLEKPVDLFLESDIDFKFCINWANENWTRRWDGEDQDVLLAQKYATDDPKRFVEDLMPYLSDHRYIKINGRHLIIVYRPGVIPKFKKILKEWRKLFKEKGLNPLFASVQGFGLEDSSSLGFDLGVEFPPHKIAQDLPTINTQIEFYDANFEGLIYDYNDLVERSYKPIKSDFPVIRGAMPSWDNEPRRKGKGTSSYSFSTPEKYKKWLANVSNFAIENPIGDDSFVFINAWNEWAEGAVLEPDQHLGYAYLEATHDILASTTNCQNSINKIIIVSHDAHKHGAQLIILNIAKTLKRQFGYDVTILLLEEGKLKRKFEEVAETIVLSDLLADPQALKNLFSGLSAQGFNKAIVNTTVAGKILPALSTSGIECINLIHELPVLIKDYGLEDTVRLIDEHAHKVIFPNKIVQQGFNTFIDQPNVEQQTVRSQGIYAIDLNQTEAIEKNKLRLELKLTSSDVIVGGLGFADSRKGIDLFAQIASNISAENRNCHFVWIGDIDPAMKDQVSAIHKKMKYKENLHFIPFQDKIQPYINDFDVFLLTSREDPFPSVVLESLALGVPTIAFEESGGIVTLNDNGQDLITLAKYLDVEDMGSKILNFANDKDLRNKVGANGQSVMKSNYQYDDYCFDLINMFSTPIKKISVVVPNYNYENYLEERLASIWNQDYPVFEVIVLDDKSPDNSLEKIEALRKKYNRKIMVIENEVNSGNVFYQWHKGAQLGRGELLWIAEADDSCESTFLTTLVAMFNKHASIGMAYAQSQQIDENGKHLANNYHYYTDEVNSSKWHTSYVSKGTTEISNGLSIRNTILNVSSVLFKSELFLKTITENLDYIVENYKVCGDWFTYLKILENSDIAFSEEALNIHRRHTQSVTKQHNHLDEVKNIHALILKQNDIDSEHKRKMEAEIEELKQKFSG